MEKKLGYSLSYTGTFDTIARRIGEAIQGGCSRMGKRDTLKIQSSVTVAMPEIAWNQIGRLVFGETIKAHFNGKSKRKGEAWEIGDESKFTRCKDFFGEKYFFFLQRLGEG